MWFSHTKTRTGTHSSCFNRCGTTSDGSQPEVGHGHVAPIHFRCNLERTAAFGSQIESKRAVPMGEAAWGSSCFREGCGQVTCPFDLMCGRQPGRWRMMNAGPLIESRIRHWASRRRCIIDISADNLSAGWAVRRWWSRRWWSQLVAMEWVDCMLVCWHALSALLFRCSILCSIWLSPITDWQWHSRSQSVYIFKTQMLSDENWITVCISHCNQYSANVPDQFDRNCVRYSLSTDAYTF